MATEKETHGIYDLYTKMITGEIRQTPQALTFGYRYTTITRDTVIVIFPVHAPYHNPYGWVGGGVIGVACDEAMGILFDMHLDEAALPMSIDHTLRFFRPVQEATLTLTASFRKKGRRIAHLECVVTDEDGHDIALATGTMLATSCEQKTVRWLARMTKHATA